MNSYLAILTAATCLCGSLVSQITVQTPVVDVGVGNVDGNYYYDDNDDQSYQDWAGPGWYYGYWFGDEDDYDAWLDNDFYNVYWGGPGWYYGVWFGDERDFNDFRSRHHQDYDHGHGIGDAARHQQEHLGQWGGSRGAGQTGTRQPSGQPRVTQPSGQARATQPSGQARPTQPSGQPRVTQPRGQPRATQPSGQPRATQPRAQARVTQPSGQPRATQPRAQARATQPRAQAGVKQGGGGHGSEHK